MRAFHCRLRFDDGCIMGLTVPFHCSHSRHSWLNTGYARRSTNAGQSGEEASGTYPCGSNHSNPHFGMDSPEQHGTSDRLLCRTATTLSLDVGMGLPANAII